MEKQKKKVLIVDDNRDAADLMGALLREEGHEVHVVYDAASALGIASAVQPEVAILDIGLPGMDGYELASRLHAVLSEIVLIALSGRHFQAVDQRARDAGFRYHFTKPIETGDLIELLSKL